MTDQPIEYDEVPSVHLELRNTTGESGEIVLHNPMLGLEPYLLISPGDDAMQVEGSHLTLNEAIQTFAFVLANLLTAEGVSDETRTEIVEFIGLALKEEK